VRDRLKASSATTIIMLFWRFISQNLVYRTKDYWLLLRNAKLFISKPDRDWNYNEADEPTA